MIKCYNCNRLKSDDAFNEKRLSHKIYLCNDCYKNDTDIRASHRNGVNKSAAKRRKQLEELRTDKPCLDCKRIYPFYVMEYDHRDDTKKVGNVTQMCRLKWQTVLDEIAKCDLICSNCHQTRTYLRAHGLPLP